MLNIITINVNAKARFYEGEYINDIYQTKYEYSTKTKYFQKARFFRRVGDDKAAYCLQPFMMYNNIEYAEQNPAQLTEAQKSRIKRLIHFGYGYKDHTSAKWYAITQLMIWQTAEPTTGEFYFTNGLNGAKINQFDWEISIINDLVNKSELDPSFANTDQYYTVGQPITLIDNNNVLSNYTSPNKEVSINWSYLTINKNIKPGDYTITLNRNNQNHNEPVLFYHADGSQDLATIGDIESKSTSFRLHIQDTKVKIIKIDEDSKTTESKGDASLDGAEYSLKNAKGNLVKTVTIKNNTAEIDNLQYGFYTLQETKPGKGYTLNNKIYEVNISTKTPTIEIIAPNKVIGKKITIEKVYGTGNTFQSEKNISFEIYNSKGDLVDTVTTKDDGRCTITLPYGTYKVVQINSTDGYTKIEPFTLNIDNSESEVISLKDYKIPVPNTSTNIFKYLLRILLQILHIK